MATRTPYYGLSKPAGIEDAQISVINANMDILDTELHLTTVRDAKNLAPIYDATSSYVEGDYVTYLITGQSSQDANGYFLFKCIDDTTTPAGNFDTNKWEAVCVTDEMGSGGGGGEGGHIFLDNEGTAMPQRAKAKFEGAYSTDNSTDGITNVAVMRTMKAMEYAQLTEEEKQGIIYVDDETTGTDDKFQPVIYSTEEREIGVWVNGKPLYERTIELSSTVATTANSWTTISGVTITDEDVIVKTEVYLGADETMASAGFGKVDNGAFKYFNTIQLAIDKIVIQYTKTTDTAGSGQWTPQGVPTVHYSTDEKVIGTWIDGSTLYEKTVHTGALSSGDPSIAHNISDLDNVIDLSGFVIYAGKKAPFPLISRQNVNWQMGVADITSTNINFEIGTNYTGTYAVTDSYVTIQYTKSS